jgi:4'-phosphopantetheinyl transferase
MSSMNLTSSFHPAPARLMLDINQVHVWRADLELGPAELYRLQKTLSPDELDRAARFHFPEDQQRFITARGVLRDILARYLGRSPAELHFSYASFGKPSLASDCAADSLRFNLSHSGSIALYAVARHREVGIDLERIEPRLAEDDIAEKFFSRNEVTGLRSLPPSALLKAFFNCWTRKEAYVKARGEGLQIPLESFDVSLAPDEQVAFLNEGEFGWSLRALLLDPDYAAAIAVEGKDWQLSLWQWQILPAG